MPGGGKEFLFPVRSVTVEGHRRLPVRVLRLLLNPRDRWGSGSPSTLARPGRAFDEVSSLHNAFERAEGLSRASNPDVVGHLEGAFEARVLVTFSVEWAIPFDRTEACLRDLHAWLDEEINGPAGLRPHCLLEVRFSSADDIWLSPSNGQRTCWIGIVQYK